MMTKVTRGRISRLVGWRPRVQTLAGTLVAEASPPPPPWMRKAVVQGGRYGFRPAPSVLGGLWLSLSVRVSQLHGLLFNRGWYGPLVYTVSVTAGAACGNASFRTRSRKRALQFTHAAIDAGARWVLCTADFPWSIYVESNCVSIDTMGWIWKPANRRLVSLETFHIREREERGWAIRTRAHERTGRDESNAASAAAIEFALAAEDGLAFLRNWHRKAFDVCRREWPEAPGECYARADDPVPVVDASAHAVALDA